MYYYLIEKHACFTVNQHGYALMDKLRKRNYYSNENSKDNRFAATGRFSCHEPELSLQ
tara:strand:+ start:8833 stop:9006 length:174 start_codon:yes stop_codon:yes gene_type:complete